MTETVAFDAAGTTLGGWLVKPGAGFAPPHPFVVLAHGFSAVKEMALDRFAAAFALRGVGAFVFDHRGFGASDGAPRQDIDPVAQARDYRHALTFLETRSEADAGRLGVWGTSLSGGHALAVAAVDRRAKCVAVQAPMVSGPETLARLIRPDLLPGIRAALDGDRRATFAGAAPALLPVVAEDPAAMAALPSRDAWDWFSRQGKTRAPAWRNEVTLRSFDRLFEYDPGAAIARIAPTPLLMIVAEADAVTPADLALEAFARAREPKSLALVPGGHFDVYEAGFDRAAGLAADWFARHLRAGG